MPRDQKGSRSPSRNGWRITGIFEPGMRSSTARSSGTGSRSSGSRWIGIVDQRFEKSESGAFAPAGPRA